MRTIETTVPLWLLVIGWFVILAGVSWGTRAWTHRRQTADEVRESSNFAKQVLSSLGAGFFFLVGFSITITWGGITAGQSAVEAEAAAAQQLIWASNFISDTAGGARIRSDLHTYLVVASSQDENELADGNFGDLPSTAHLDTLEDTVHEVAFRADGPVPEATSLVSAAAALAAQQGQISAVARRSLPPPMLLLIIMSGLVLAVGMGMSATGLDRPKLMYGWALVASMAIGLVFVIDFPFGGDIAVSLAPLADVADRMNSGP